MALRAAPAGVAALRDRAVEASGGNPGLLALLATAIASEPAVVPGVLAEMEAHLAKGAQPSDPQLADFLTDLVLDRLVAMLDPDDRALLRALRLFDLPVPVDILRLLEGSGGAVGGRLDRLFNLGLLSRGDDLVSPDVPAAILTELVRARTDLAPSLSADETAAVAAVVVDPLFRAWGGDRGEQRPYSGDLQLLDLALVARNATVAKACAADAIRGLDRSLNAPAAARKAEQAIELLNAARIDPGIDLLRTAADVEKTVGDVAKARAWLMQADSAYRRDSSATSAIDAGALNLSLGRLRRQDGDIAGAINNFDEARGIFERLGDVRSRAVTLGEIAGILAGQGEIDEALKLHREALAVYERLGDGTCQRL
jgi:tetratricopeptide (TPR) repeat protein